MSNKKPYLILQANSSKLTLIKEELTDGTGGFKYVFSGPCADFNDVNDNGRIYDKDDYLSHIEYLMEDIKLNRLLGEVDHNEQEFDPKMRDISHIIKDLWYDEEKNQVWIKIELIANRFGKDIMAAVDAGVPIYISSRASGFIDDKGKVTLEKIYTYDIVYRPGFSQAKLERMNESLGVKNDSVLILEFNNNLTKINNNKNNDMGYIDDKKFEEYTEIVKVQFSNLEQKINKFVQLNENSLKLGVRHGVTDFTSNNKELVSLFENKRKELKEEFEKITVRSDKRSIQEQIIINEHIDSIASRINESIQFIDSLTSMTKKNKRNVFEAQKNIASLSSQVSEMKIVINNMIDYINTKIDPKFGVIEKYMESQNKNISTLNENAINIASKVNGVIANTKALNTSLNESLSNIKNVKSKMIKEDLNDLQADTCKNLFGECDDLGVEDFKLDADKGDLKAGDYKKIVSDDMVYLIDEKGESKILSTQDFANLTKVEEKKDYTALTNSLVEKATKDKQEKEVLVLETKYPFIKNLNDVDRRSFLSLHEINRKRISEGVINGSINVDNISALIKESFNQNDEMVNLLSNITPNQMKIWEGLSKTQKGAVLNLYKLKGVKPGYQTEVFWEGLEFENKEFALKSLITENHTPTTSGIDSSLGYNDKFIDERLGINN